MAEKVVSPGVFTNELDQSFLPAAIGEIGAAIVGPTAKGPAMVPTVVSSFSEFEQTFGTTVKSGSNYYTYLTSLAAQNYLRHGNKLTVVRILDGNFSPASASISNGSTAGVGSGSIMILNGSDVDHVFSNDKFTIGGTDFIFVSGSGNAKVGQVNINTDGVFNQTSTDMYIHSSSTAAETAANIVDVLNSGSVHGLNISASIQAGFTNVVQFSGTGASHTLASSSQDGTKPQILFGGSQAVTGDADNVPVSTSMAGATGTVGSSTTFEMYTLDDGVQMNSVGVADTNSWGTGLTNQVLPSGSKDNIRWEITNVNNKKGVFTLTIRSGQDSNKRKQVLETWNNLSLDPTANNYIEKIIGSQELSYQFNSGDPFIQPIGDYPQKSKYIRVKNVLQTPDYLDENGNLTDSAQSASLPALGSGSYSGGFEGGTDGTAGINGSRYGANFDAVFYDRITSATGTDVQGFNISNTSNPNGGTAYSEALTLLANQDEYDINMLMIPGVTNDAGSAIIDKAITTCEDRGDCFVIADPVGYGAGQASAITQAESYDSNYAAMYWPWVQVQDNNLGRNVWVPPSVVLGGIYAFNDKVAHPWFAPAGLNRGGVDTAIQAERKLTHSNRDTMYESNLNPIATFPGQGVTVFGQKTLQKKSSALDRVNVRRLMIKVKKFIAASSRFLVFEQNNVQTRRRFLNIANPYLEQVQSNSGLNAFKVVMDDTNNTPDVVDRNILYGQIFLQPTKTAEFIVLDFTVQPTGATFPE